MPTYEYVCTDCGQDLEVVQSFSDPALTECPQCAGKLRKRYSPVGVVFKGSGFYKTDSRQKVRKGTDEAAKPAATAAGDGEAASSAAKSETVAGKGAGGADGKGSDGAAKSSGGGDSGGDSGGAGQKAAAAGRSGSGPDSGSGKGSRKPSSSAA